MWGREGEGRYACEQIKREKYKILSNFDQTHRMHTFLSTNAENDFLVGGLSIAQFLENLSDS